MRFLRQFQDVPAPRKPEKKGKMKVFIPEEHWEKKNFKGGEYTDFEEIK